MIKSAVFVLVIVIGLLVMMLPIAASSGPAATSTVWPTTHPDTVPSLVAPEYVFIYDVAWSKDNHLVVSSSAGLHLFDVADLTQPPQWFDTTQDYPPNVAFSPDASLIASTGAGDQIRLWDVITGQQIRLLPGHKGGTRAVLFDSTGTWLYSGGGDGLVRKWDAATGKQLESLSSELPCPEEIYLNEDLIAVAGWSWTTDGCRGSVGGTSVQVWEQGWTPQISTIEEGPVEGLALVPGTHKFLISAGRSLYEWNVRRDEWKTVANDGPEWSDAGMSLSPDGDLVAYAAVQTIFLYDADIQPAGILEGCHLSWIAGLAFNLDGTYLASYGAQDGQVCIWDVNQQRVFAILRVS
jgi:WD40 repeat protein